mmetsp:Transcript_2939/g.9010  ORF Transcript_2939/g.9010 Transcript_2939/m.9010 type:complete len:91 (+) Transcript_2939:2578-2850(+)|eukprot:scaffold44662_cov28-Tisochrysis_lutea.AAC.7
MKAALIGEKREDSGGDRAEVVDAAADGVMDGGLEDRCVEKCDARVDQHPEEAAEEAVGASPLAAGGNETAGDGVGRRRSWCAPWRWDVVR